MCGLYQLKYISMDPVPSIVPLYLQEWGACSLSGPSSISCRLLFLAGGWSGSFVIQRIFKKIHLYLNLQLFSLRKTVVETLLYSETFNSSFKWNVMIMVNFKRHKWEGGVSVLILLEAIRLKSILSYFVNPVWTLSKYHFCLLYIHSLAVKNCITEDALCTFWEAN